MKQWEYKTIWVSSVQFSEDDLNEAGELGWELVNIYRENSWFYAVFKRPKE